MTGYGVAFPRGSKYLAPFNEKLLEYIENGKDLSPLPDCLRTKASYPPES